MVNTSKYPFKHMKAIIRAFIDTEKPLSIRDIQKSSHACYSDTSEVTQMLSYITSFGKIIQKDGRWMRIDEIEKKPSKPGRSYYLNDMLKIINALPLNIPKTETEILQNTGLGIEQIKKVLPFISSITGQGCIVADGKRFTRTFKLLQLENDNN